MTDQQAATVPTLVLSGSGQVVDADTGSIVPVDDPTALPSTITGALDTYARAKVAADALSFQLEEREAAVTAELAARIIELEGERESAALEDEEAAGLRERISEAREVMAATEATFDGFFSDRSKKVSFDVGNVLATWGKPRSRWSLASPPSYYATGSAELQLRRLIENELPAGHDINVCRIAVAIIEWLNPTEKVSDPPPVKLTVRGVA